MGAKNKNTQDNLRFACNESICTVIAQNHKEYEAIQVTSKEIIDLLETIDRCSDPLLTKQKGKFQHLQKSHTYNPRDYQLAFNVGRYES